MLKLWKFLSTALFRLSEENSREDYWEKVVSFIWLKSIPCINLFAQSSSKQQFLIQHFQVLIGFNRRPEICSSIDCCWAKLLFNTQQLHVQENRNLNTILGQNILSSTKNMEYCWHMCKNQWLMQTQNANLVIFCKPLWSTWSSCLNLTLIKRQNIMRKNVTLNQRSRIV